MLLIYSPEENPRISWACDLLLRGLLGIKYRITVRTDEIREYEGPRLAYSFHPIDQIPVIGASGLLFEKDIHDQSPHLETGYSWKELPVIFQLKKFDGKALLPFDIFSALFYFVTRYEEYLPFNPDKHGRFPSTESLAHRMNVVVEPIVNKWALAFLEILARIYGPAIKPGFPEYRFIPTIDVDNAYAYAQKGIIRTLGGLWRDRHDMEARNYRFQVLRKNQSDPYDTYSLLHRLHRNFKVEPVWFFLAGQYGKHDKNINPRKNQFQNLVKSIDDDFDTGLHPSYASNLLPGLLETELNTLSGITGKPVIRSRQHYLKIRFPDTYRTLAAAGIREDFSLGFADQPGFRPGIANPFRFFDLASNETTDLTIYPFQVMDTSLRQYLGLNPEEAAGKIREIIQKIKQVNGTFISLWHNESLSEWKEWQGWSQVYWHLLQSAGKTV